MIHDEHAVNRGTVFVPLDEYPPKDECLGIRQRSKEKEHQKGEEVFDTARFHVLVPFSKQL